MAKNVINEEQKADAKRLKAIYSAKAKSLGLTQEKLGIALGGTGQSTAGNYLNGITALNLKSALVFANQLEVEISEFSPVLSKLIKETRENVHPVETKTTKVPLISWVIAGDWCESPDNFAPGDADEWLLCPSAHSDKTYALRVVGDSMTSSIPGERSYPQGMIIFVDPERVAVVGSRVIARLPDSAEATFKVYTEDAGKPYLMPINTRYPAIHMPEGTIICGVVIGSFMPE